MLSEAFNASIRDVCGRGDVVFCPLSGSDIGVSAVFVYTLVWLVVSYRPKGGRFAFKEEKYDE